MEISRYQYRNVRQYLTPGVYFEDVTPRRVQEFRTGVPAFLGFAPPSDSRGTRSEGSHSPGTITGWPQFDEAFSGTPSWGFLRDAVRGFFENGGEQCVIVPLPFDTDRPSERSFSRTELDKVFELLDPFEDVDLICFPDAALAGERTLEVQQQVLEACNGTTGRFAILDSQRTNSAGTAARSFEEQDLRLLQQQWHELPAEEGALYFPWLHDRQSRHKWIPPCGHVAGIFSRVDSAVGVHKAPANEIVEGAVDIQVRVNDLDQGALNDAGINCLRALPGRGIRVWGARTLNGLPNARYVNVRRLLLTLVRRITHSFRDVVFEPYTPSLWDMIRNRLNGFCLDLFESGAIRGSSPTQAFYVKCDGETNSREETEAGMVIAHIGLAAISPAEFIVVRIAHTAAGARILSPAQVEQRR